MDKTENKLQDQFRGISRSAVSGSGGKPEKGRAKQKPDPYFSFSFTNPPLEPLFTVRS